MTHKQRPHQESHGPRSALWCLLPVSCLFLSACPEPAVNLEVESQADSSHPLHDLADEVLTVHQGFEEISIVLSCDEATPSTCLLRLEAGDKVSHGPGSALVLNVVPGVQPLPGFVDLSAPYQDAFEAEPVVYALTENVDETDAATRYDFDCRYQGGWLYLFANPRAEQPLSGEFELEVSCIEKLLPSEPVPAVMRGEFSGMVSER